MRIVSISEQHGPSGDPETAPRIDDRGVPFAVPGGLRFRLDRAAASSLTEQISVTIRAAILERRLAPGARLPSWRDLAAQLGVARGTVRAAYERLADELLVAASGPGGTHVAERLPRAAATAAVAPPVPDTMPWYAGAPRPFEMGVPASAAAGNRAWFSSSATRLNRST